MDRFSCRAEQTASVTTDLLCRFLRRAAVVTIALVAGAYGTANAAAFGQPVVLGHGVNPKVAVNDAGAAVAVWQQRLRSSAELVAAIRSSDGNWSTPVTIGTTRSSVNVERRLTQIDVAIDPEGNAVVVWTRIRESSPLTADVMTVKRPRAGRWSEPQVLVTVGSPHEDVNVGPFFGIRPRVMVDANGDAVAVWARVLPAAGAQRSPGRYAVEAVTMGADGRWSRPQLLGETSDHPALDRSATGETAVVWSLLTCVHAPPFNCPTTEVIAATWSAAGGWSSPSVVVRNQEKLVAGVLYGPGRYFGAKVALERDGGLTAVWAGAGLQVSSRENNGHWSAPQSLARGVVHGGPFLSPASHGEITAVWVADPRGRSHPPRLRATTRDVNGAWSVPTTALIAEPGDSRTKVTDVAISASSRVIALVARGVERSDTWQSRLEAYVRTPAERWLPAQILGKPRPRRGHSCNAGDAALADDGRGAAVWICRTGAGRAPKVMSTTIPPPRIPSVVVRPR